MKVSTENDNNFGYEKITIVVDNIPLSNILLNQIFFNDYPKKNVLTSWFGISLIYTTSINAIIFVISSFI
jgi:hypothetical protein